ncbi:hypothetical protein ACFL4Q_03615 [candidate division KSB1 bacterium]
MSPGKYFFGCGIKQEEANIEGIYQYGLEIKDFSGDGLMLSDLRICLLPESEPLTPGIHRDQLNLAPYPFLHFRKEAPLALYFEIYNIAPAGNGRTSYSIEYSIEQQSFDQSKGISDFFRKIGRFITGRKTATITLSHERTGTAQTAYELIQFDLNAFPESESLITVTVTDKSSGKDVSSYRQIRIVK